MEGNKLETTFKRCFNDVGIMPENTPSYSVEANARAERLYRTPLNKARLMVYPLGSDHSNLWAGEIATENYIRKRMHSDGFQRYGVTPKDAFGRQAKKGMAVDYLGGSYKVYCPATGRIAITKDVRMIENTAEQRGESTIDLEEPAFNLPPVEVDQPIPDPVTEVGLIGLSQLYALTHFPENCGSTRITQETDLYEGGKIWWR